MTGPDRQSGWRSVDYRCVHTRDCTRNTLEISVAAIGVAHLRSVLLHGNCTDGWWGGFGLATRLIRPGLWQQLELLVVSPERAPLVQTWTLLAGLHGCGGPRDHQQRTGERQTHASSPGSSNVIVVIRTDNPATGGTWNERIRQTAPEETASGARLNVFAHCIGTPTEADCIGTPTEAAADYESLTKSCQLRGCTVAEQAPTQRPLTNLEIKRCERRGGTEGSHRYAELALRSSPAARLHNR